MKYLCVFLAMVCCAAVAFAQRFPRITKDGYTYLCKGFEEDADLQIERIDQEVLDNLPEDGHLILPTEIEYEGITRHIIGISFEVLSDWYLVMATLREFRL